MLDIAVGDSVDVSGIGAPFTDADAATSVGVVIAVVDVADADSVASGRSDLVMAVAVASVGVVIPVEDVADADPAASVGVSVGVVQTLELYLI